MLIDPWAEKTTTFISLPVLGKPVAARELGGILLTDFQRPQQNFEYLLTVYPLKQIIAPPMLNVSSKIRVSSGRHQQ